MRPEKMVAWLKELVERGEKIPRHHSFDEMERGWDAITYDEVDVYDWITESEIAFRTLLERDRAHELGRSWESLVNIDKKIYERNQFERMLALVKMALRLARDGRLDSMFDAVRAETVAELLDQADTLRKQGYLVAATVIAGGALETHLKHLCDKNGIPPMGAGSISKYDQSISQARNAGTVEVYSSGDTKKVTAWGDDRNLAAHNPSSFYHTSGQVDLMIQGIRQFVERTSH
jgi:hypothetical protein